MMNSYTLEPVGFIRSTVEGREDAPRQGPEGAPDAREFHDETLPQEGAKTARFWVQCVVLIFVPCELPRMFASTPPNRNFRWNRKRRSSLRPARRFIRRRKTNRELPALAEATARQARIDASVWRAVAAATWRFRMLSRVANFRLTPMPSTAQLRSKALMAWERFSASPRFFARRR
jgi:hypothetical protein